MKKTISLIMSFFLIVSMLSGMSFSAYAANDDSGSCGDSVSYTFEAATGVLTLTGTGKTEWYASGETPLRRTPWYSYRESITKVVVGEGITQLNLYVLSKLTNVKTIVLPSTLTTISSNAFYNDTSLEVINLGDTKITSIGLNAFENCSALSDVTLPETMTEISDFAFRNAGVKRVNFPESCTKIGNYAFYGCSMATITLPETISSVGLRAFANNTFLLSVYIYNPNMSFGGNDPFDGCQTNLTFYGHGGSTTASYAAEKGYKFVSIDDCEHLNTHAQVTLAPTCTEKGSQDIICDDCGIVLRTEEIAATGHDLQIIQVDDQTEKNGHVFNYYRCANCNDPETDVIRMTHARDEEGNYIWVEGNYTDTVLQEATCTKSGIVVRRCNIEDPMTTLKCAATETFYTPAPGHQVEEWTVTVEPTCTTDGSRTGVCTVCGETVVETIKGGHSYEVAEGEVREDGHRVDTYTCSVCGDSYTELVHVEWIEGYYSTRTLTEPSCLMTGTSIDTCTVEGCSKTRTNVVPASGHSYRFVLCDGTTCNYKCENCESTRTMLLTLVNSGFVSNQGNVSEHLLGYYYDINNDGWVNGRDYVLLSRMSAQQPEQPDTGTETQQ